MFQVRNGKAVVPGGARAEKTWTDLLGVAPDKPGAFFERLVAKDDGWMASYFDALLRITYNPANGPVLNYLTEPERLKRFYTAIRGRVTSPGPARPVFRSNTDMLLLTTRLRLNPDQAVECCGRLERSRRRDRSPVRPVPQGGGERAVEDFYGVERCGSPPQDASGCRHGRPNGAAV
jgi:hypothetical protein